MTVTKQKSKERVNEKMKTTKKKRERGILPSDKAPIVGFIVKTVQ